jgi:MGT family glycosyltransferase
VYGSLGTVSAFNAQPGALRMVIDAIAACGMPDVVGLVTCGDNQDPASFGPLPKNVRLANFIPQALLLPHCRAVVCHGGYGTTMGALSFGVPLVITPLGADQPQHAHRCQALGVGEMLLPGQVTLPALTGALTRVLRDPGYTQRARAFRAELEALPDAAAAVRLLVSEAAR